MSTRSDNQSITDNENSKPTKTGSAPFPVRLVGIMITPVSNDASASSTLRR